MGKKKGGGFFGGIANAVTGGLAGALGLGAQPKEPKINFPQIAPPTSPKEAKDLSRAELGRISAGAQAKTKGLMAPAYLELGPDLSPLQQRTAIATRASSGSLGQDPEAFKHFYDISFSSLADPTGKPLGEPTPIERQYLQVFGEPQLAQTTESYLSALQRIYGRMGLK